MERILAEQYRIDAIAGQGGFGDVYKGYDLRMDRPVAIKRTGKVDDSEAEILRKLDHSGLPRLYDILAGNENIFTENENTVSPDEGNTIIVMEWIEGMTLEEYLTRNGALTEEKAIRIGMEILEILFYLHSQSPAIIYQDLKPSNIMVMPDGHIKLIDFGTAFFMTYGDEGQITAGTVGYGAPEQRGITGAFYANERSDIYSWGAVMYTMLSGRMLNRPPYTMDKIRRLCPHISFGLERIIRKATARNNKDRYENITDLKRAFKRRPLLDMGYRLIFFIFMSACIMPFVLAWCIAYRGGVFAYLQRAVLVVHDWWRTSLGLKYEDRLRVLKTAFRLSMSVFDDRQKALIRMESGLLLISSAWMVLGLRLAAVRKYIKVKRSVFLSERKYPGLWVGALIVGIIAGYGLGQDSEAAVAYAEESINSHVLPVSLIDSNGNKMLVDYGSVLEVDGDFRMVIDDVGGQDDGNQELEVKLKNMDTGYVSRRTFYIK